MLIKMGKDRGKKMGVRMERWIQVRMEGDDMTEKGEEDIVLYSGLDHVDSSMASQ